MDGYDWAALLYSAGGCLVFGAMAVWVRFAVNAASRPRRRRNLQEVNND